MTDTTAAPSNVTVIKGFFDTPAKPVTRQELSDLGKEERQVLADEIRANA